MSFFGKIKAKATQALLKRQMKDLPPEQQELMMKAIEANPDFFEKIAQEIKEKTDAGGNQMYAAMQVMQKYQSEMQKIFGGLQ